MNNAANQTGPAGAKAIIRGDVVILPHPAKPTSRPKPASIMFDE